MITTLLALVFRFSTFTTLHQAKLDQGAQNKSGTANRLFIKSRLTNEFTFYKKVPENYVFSPNSKMILVLLLHHLELASESQNQPANKFSSHPL